MDPKLCKRASRGERHSKPKPAKIWHLRNASQLLHTSNFVVGDRFLREFIQPPRRAVAHDLAVPSIHIESLGDSLVHFLDADRLAGFLSMPFRD